MLSNTGLSVYLTPLIPLSFKGEGEEKERGAKAPLKHPFRERSDRFNYLIIVYLNEEVAALEQTFEATIEKRDKWYIGWVDAVPGAFSQGRTVREVEQNLKEAVQLILESQRELKDKGSGGGILKRKIQVQV